MEGWAYCLHQQPEQFNTSKYHSGQKEGGEKGRGMSPSHKIIMLHKHCISRREEKKEEVSPRAPLS
jgi:hypothetical protein